MLYTDGGKDMEGIDQGRDGEGVLDAVERVFAVVYELVLEPGARGAARR